MHSTTSTATPPWHSVWANRWLSRNSAIPATDSASPPALRPPSRDRFYRTIFSRLLRDAARGGIIAGCNFWGWGSYAKPAHLRWQQGDDYCGDPAQEEQGLNSVFASDTTTLREIAQANRTLQLHAASSACGSGNRNPAEVLRTLRAAAASGRFFFGQQDYPFYGVSWSYEPERSDVSDVCGDRPAVLGCDLGELELAKGRNLDGVPFETMRRMIVDHHRHEGLVTLSWHPRNPLTGGDAWDVSQRNVVHEVLPGGSCHDRFMGWLDDVAAFITSLRTAEGETIPVLFPALARAHRKLVLVGRGSMHFRRVQGVVANDRGSAPYAGSANRDRLFAESLYVLPQNTSNAGPATHGSMYSAWMPTTETVRSVSSPA